MSIINHIIYSMQKTFTLVSSTLQSTKNKQHRDKHVVDNEPSDSAIQNILNYSKSLTIRSTKTIGAIEIIAS
jgi:hypothetical protein